ncbi:MAG: hypothetical protein ACPGNV_14160 [Mangrovicoccus sp.]
MTRFEITHPSVKPLSRLLRSSFIFGDDLTGGGFTHRHLAFMPLQFISNGAKKIGIHLIGH